MGLHNKCRIEEENMETLEENVNVNETEVEENL